MYDSLKDTPFDVIISEQLVDEAMENKGQKQGTVESSLNQ